MARRPFLAALLLPVALLSACGSAQQASPSSTASSVPKSSQSQASAAPSVCGLPEYGSEVSLTTAPTVDEWRYENQTLWPYPYAKAFGPGVVKSNGMRSCFSHNPQGALFAAANIAAMTTDQNLMNSPDNAISLFGKGSQYDRLAAKIRELGSFPVGSAADSRGTPAGFRMLDYTATEATVDLGFVGTSSGQSVNISIVYHLVWSDGDWKLRSEKDIPITSAVVPSFTGYVEWKVNG
ncbi:MAG: hypothetical protein ACTILK_07095 [Bifidobacterium crudilactis]|uniref:hypothetical protein n=1 Tax=Bifidobacterium crudilactis TaxID=327277 RepID=UPI003F9D72F0